MTDRDPEPGKVIEFRLPPPPPSDRDLRNETTIEALEALLAQARRGEIVSIAAAYERPEGDISVFWTSPEDRPRLGFAIRLLEHRFLTQSVETATNTDSVPT